MPIPTIRPLEARDARSTRVLVVLCPHCGRKHEHGHPFEDTSPRTHRVAHCQRLEDRAGYYIDTSGLAP